jgi:hypothetical protein
MLLDALELAVLDLVAQAVGDLVEREEPLAVREEVAEMDTLVVTDADPLRLGVPARDPDGDGVADGEAGGRLKQGNVVSSPSFHQTLSVMLCEKYSLCTP